MKRKENSGEIEIAIEEIEIASDTDVSEENSDPGLAGLKVQVRRKRCGT